MNSTMDLLLHGWEIHPSVILGCAALVACYSLPAARPHRFPAAYLLGTLILCLSLISPMDPLGDQYLFSAHMLQHLLLILIVPPLLILGLSQELVARWMKSPSMRRCASMLGAPAVAWPSNMLMMVVWHIPVLYNLANANTAVHILEHLTFLITGCMFWWPIVSPLQEQRIACAPAMIYLFGAAVICTLLGIVITFLPIGLYKPYVNPLDSMGILPLIRNTWGISAEEDQKLAGLLMWVPACSIYFSVMLVELGFWFQTPGDDKPPLSASFNPAQGEAHDA